MYISKERKFSELKGTGVQYIPGHVEPLVDLVIAEYLPNNSGAILDLGGGGLRFAIPVTAKKKGITVVDLDPSGLDIDNIYSKLCENDFLDIPDIKVLKKKIIPVFDNVFHFLETSMDTFSLITAFRLIHFLNEEELINLFSIIYPRLEKKGRLVISALSPFGEDNSTLNEFFIHSNALNDNNFYRRFNNSSEAKRLQSEQNLGDFIHLFSEDYLVNFANEMKLKLIAGNLPSTRTVRGYIFEK